MLFAGASAVNSSLQAHPLLASWSWETTTNSVFWTPALFEFFGLDPALPPPAWANQTQLYTPDSFSRLDAAVRRCLETGDPYRLQLKGIHASGREIHLEAHGAAERNESGQIIGLFGLFIDRTKEAEALHALEEAKERAESANEARSRFLISMNHEIRTPLNAIIGMAELLEHDSKRPDVKDCLHAIHSSGDVLLSLLNDILDFTKIETGEIKLAMAPMNIRSCVEESMNIICATATEKALEFRVLIPPEVPETVMGDALRLRQVLLNLLMNAVKFTEQGQVILSLSYQRNAAESGSISFTISDTGIGMSAEEQARLLQPLDQTETPASRSHGGKGLGIAFSQKLVEMMGGALSVASTAGAGSSFCFSLPVIPTAESVAPSPVDPAAPVANFFLGMNAPLKILVAEDIRLNQQVIELMLSRLGYDNVVTVSNGIEALEALEKASFDLILMDIQMPRMNGLEATEAILKKHPSDNRPQIVALTANATKEDRDICLNAGMTDYLIKPLRRDKLAALLQEVHARLPAKRSPSVTSPAR